jgi:hypothetical protein
MQGVPDSDQTQASQAEGHGTFHGTTQAIMGLSHTDDLAGVSECLLDSPAGRIPSHQLFSRRFEIGGDKWKSVTTIIAVEGAGFVVADQNNAHRSSMKRSIPQADHLSDMHGVGTPIAADPRGAPRRGHRDIGCRA